jgi:hypothetical protein
MTPLHFIIILHTSHGIGSHYPVWFASEKVNKKRDFWLNFQISILYCFPYSNSFVEIPQLNPCICYRKQHTPPNHGTLILAKS